MAKLIVSTLDAAGKIVLTEKAVKSVAQTLLTKGRGKANKVYALPLNEAFRHAQQGAVVYVKVLGGFEGLCRVKQSVGRSGRPSLPEHTNWNLPTGSTMLVMDCLDKSGNVLNLNWRRDHDIIESFDVREVPVSDEKRDTLTHKSWTHAVDVASVVPVTAESHQLPAGPVATDYIAELNLSLTNGDATIVPEVEVFCDESVTLFLESGETASE